MTQESAASPRSHVKKAIHNYSRVNSQEGPRVDLVMFGIKVHVFARVWKDVIGFEERSSR